MDSNKTTNAPWIIGALLLGASMWGVVWYPMRLLEQAGLSGLWLTLCIYLAAMVATAWYSVRVWREPGKHPWLMLQLALYAGWTNIAFVLAVLDGNIMRVLLLFYLSPLWAVILACMFLSERLNRIAVATIALALIGAVLMLWHPQLDLPWPSGRADWLAITAGMAFAASNVVVRKTQDISIASKLGVTWIGVVVIASTLIVLNAEPVPVWTTTNVLGAIAVGVLAIAVMTALVQYGVTNMPIHRSAVILLFELVAGAISQQLLTDEVMTIREWIGGVAIIAAAYVSAQHG